MAPATHPLCWAQAHNAQLSAPATGETAVEGPGGSSLQGKGRQLRSSFGTTLHMVAIITVPENVGSRYQSACCLLDTLPSILYTSAHLSLAGSRRGRHCT